MKKRIGKRIASIFLVIVMTIALFPDYLISVRASEAAWVHMNDDEKGAEKASYNISQDEITFVNDWGWANRMRYIGVSDVAGKDYVVEFDLSVDGGLIGVFNYEDSGSMYGVYLDTNAGQLDRLQFTDWVTCVDDFNFRESTTAGATVHDNIAATNWDGTTDKGGSHLRVEFLCGQGGTLAGGTVNYYKKDSLTGEYLFLGSVTTPDNVIDDASLQNYFGIQLWIGNGTVSNITVEEYAPFATAEWVHMSDSEKAEGKAVYNIDKNQITFVNDWGWANRMKYIGVPDVSGKDYAVEFDLSVDGGLIGVFNYEDSGSMYGVYLDTNAAQLDTLQFTDWLTCVDDFNFRESTEGATVHPNVSAANWDATTDKNGSHIRVEFIRGENGTLAGGTVNYYKQDAATQENLLLGSVAIPDNVADDAQLSNYFGVQLWIGNGTVSNLSLEEIKTDDEGGNEGGGNEDNKEEENENLETDTNGKWVHVSDAEKAEKKAAYNSKKDTITFKNDWGWANRMKYIGIPDTTGKNYTIEFDLSVDGGLLGVFNYEDSGSLYGVYLDTSAAQLDALHFDDWLTCKDDFYFRETVDGTKTHLNIGAANWESDIDKKNSHLRVEILCGENGTLAGGTVNYYKRDAKSGKYLFMGTMDIPKDLKDDPNLPNYFGIQLWIGNGTVSNITFKASNAVKKEQMDVKQPTWVHINDAEKQVGDAVYNQSSGTIKFKGCDGWSSRLVNTKISDISGKNFAVEFDADLSSGAIGISPFYEDAFHFYTVYFDVAGNLLDGVGMNGQDKQGNAVLIDEFSYIDDTIYPHFSLENLSPTKGQDVRIRIECFNGSKGTMAGGTAHFYFKRRGFDEWVRLGVLKMPTTIVDDSETANKVLIHGRATNGTISDISVIENISGTVLPYDSSSSEKWGYVSDYEKLVQSAYYSDETGVMQLCYDSTWNSRMIYLEESDISGKAFAVEFNADCSSGGAIGVAPFYEDAFNWYGVYVDRGAGIIDGVGYGQGEIMDDFNYVEASTYSTMEAQSNPVLTEVRYRFEFYPAIDGSAANGTCKIFYKQCPGGTVTDEMWRMVGEYTLPDTILDNADVANKLVVSTRLMSATLSDITYEEISADTFTEYYGGFEEYTFEEEYPTDEYTEASGQGMGIAWWSIVMMAVGACSLIGLSVWQFVLPTIRKKQKV